MRSLIRFAVRRPVATCAFYCLIVALACLAYLRLPVALLPEIRVPSLAVWTAYPDASPDRVEHAVTELIEEAIAGTPGLRRLTSRSQLGGCLVRLDLGWNVDLDLAFLEVREQLDRLNALPKGAQRPLVLRFDPGDRPILLIAATARGAADSAAAESTPRPDLVAAKQVARTVVARRLEQLNGVARVRVTGGFDREIRIAVDADKMAAYGVGLERIEEALSQANVALPGGLIRRGPFSYAVEVSGEFAGLEDVRAAVIPTRGGRQARLRDLATVSETVADRRGLVRLDGRETLLLLVERRPDANTVETARAVRRSLADLSRELPGLDFDVVVDQSFFIEAAVSAVTKAALFGALLAVAVLLVFLRSPRALLAVALAVPLSLAITLVLFELFDVTLNLLSLGGLALGVGMLVDNAIVVVDNITRWREKGRAPLQAAQGGASQVALAITASTLTTVAVFLPLTLVEGLAGRLFADQSLAVVASLMASLFVAMTAVPLIASRQRPRRRSRSPRWSFRPYERSLGWCLRHRGTVVAAAAGLLVVAGILAWRLPREVVPKVDQGRLELHLTLPPEADLPLLSRRSASLESQIAGWPVVRHVLADLGQRDEAGLELDPRPPYEATLVLVLDPAASVSEVTNRLRVLDVAADLELRSRRSRTQLEELLLNDESDLVVDLTSDRRSAARAMTERLLAALRTRDQLAQVTPADSSRIPAYELRFQLDAMERFGVRRSAIAAAVEAVAQGRKATALRTVNEEIPIVIRSAPAESIEELLARQVPTEHGLLPLAVFLDASLVQLPASLIRSDQGAVVRFNADIAPGADLTEALSAIGQSFDEVLPEGVSGRVRGTNEAFLRTLRAAAWSLALSTVLVFLILAAQFESLLEPLVILAAVPLAAAGVVLALSVTGQTLNLMSLTGCVVLVGIVVNDAILKVDAIDRLRRRGMARFAAIQEAGRQRLRPILMTTATTVLGLTPLALGLGEGAELRAALAIAVIGGLLTGTSLTLLVVPILHSLIPDRGAMDASPPGRPGNEDG
ncbi:MAG: efflux RND transporter permease subunit [bacterium]|nr:efflux RND transporter permease subunit [bacterium]